MDDGYRLPASVQRQTWVNDRTRDDGDAVRFDAHDAMLSLPAGRFRAVAGQILADRGHDYDELALESGVVDDWLRPGMDRTFLVSVDGTDFEDWLASVGLTPHEAVTVTDERLEPLRPAPGAKVRHVVDGLREAGDLSCHAASDALRSLLANWQAAALQGDCDSEGFKDDYRRMLKELENRQEAVFAAIDAEYGREDTPAPR